MRMYHTLHILSIICLSITSINAATLFVTNLLDDGSPGSLRETIANASGSDVIKFSVAGTILLNEALGELVIDKELTIDGQFKIAVDGQDQINICFHITGASASNSIIQNITIQNFNGHDVDPGSGTASQEFPAHGIFITDDAENCAVITTTIRNIHSGINQEASGIKSSKNTGDLLGNTIEMISSEDNSAGNTGLVVGISLRTGNIVGDCSSNTICNLSSGTATNDSGTVIGILTEDGGGEIQGDCTHNTIYNLLSGTANNDSGSVVGIFANEIQGNCSDNTLYNFTSSIAANNSFRLFSGLTLGIIGIIVLQTITGDCSNNTISHLTSGQANNTSGSVGGIIIDTTLEGNCFNNTIKNLLGGSADTSRSVLGIFINGSLEGNCLNNTIQQLRTGDANLVDNSITGIVITELNGNCLNNLVTDISITGAITIERSGGIRFSSVDDGNLLACNTIRRITGGGGGLTFGMEIEEGNNLTIRNNTIDSVKDNNGPAHGIFLGSDMGTAGITFVTNSLILSNTISNIIGNMLTGFGISIFGIGTGGSSTGNDLLNNSIFNINGKAINIIDNGLPVDATVTLQSAVCGNQCIFIRGTLDPEPGFEMSEFLLQFFASNKCSPAQTQTFLGQTTVTALFSTPFVTKITPCIVIDETQCITATATALPPGTGENNNTSEVSNTIPGCDNDFVCALATTLCDLEPPPCPILIAQ